jgi:hypothetical protein
MICSRLLRALCCSALLGFASQSFAANSIAWNESVNGDVSNSPTAPTQINLTAGTNSFIATMPGADLDFFTVHVPGGTVLSGIFNSAYDSLDQVSFIAIGPGTSMPAAVLAYDPTGLLGYSHFGPGVFDPGTDLLPYLAVENPPYTPGFVPPLPAGAYTFWLQQESSVDTGYQLDFVVGAVPEPASAVLLLAGGLCAAVHRSKRRV